MAGDGAKKSSGERKRSNQMKGWRRNGCSGGKMARYRRAHFLCRPFVMYSWEWRGGRMDGGAEGSNAGRGGSSGGGWGVMNSWPIPSRMPSNLCYKEGHPSSRQAAALYTTARTRKHAARMPDSRSQKKKKRAQWSQPGAPVRHPQNSITPSSVEGCSATPLLGAGRCCLFCLFIHQGLFLGSIFYFLKECVFLFFFLHCIVFIEMSLLPGSETTPWSFIDDLDCF